MSFSLVRKFWKKVSCDAGDELIKRSHIYQYAEFREPLILQNISHALYLLAVLLCGYISVHRRNERVVVQNGA